MVEEEPVTVTQIVQTGFPVGGGDQSVFGAFAVAHSQHGALPAIPWQGRIFGFSEGFLAG